MRLKHIWHGSERKKRIVWSSRRKIPNFNSRVQGRKYGGVDELLKKCENDKDWMIFVGLQKTRSFVYGEIFFVRNVFRRSKPDGVE